MREGQWDHGFVSVEALVDLDVAAPELEDMIHVPGRLFVDSQKEKWVRVLGQIMQELAMVDDAAAMRLIRNSVILTLVLGRFQARGGTITAEAPPGEDSDGD